jgi:enoyl-CoA hydratase/carnithine racemase
MATVDKTVTEPATESVTYERIGDVGVITLQEGRLNLFTNDSFLKLEEILHEIPTSGIRALVLRSGAEHFSAGVNVEIFKDVSADEARAMFGRLLPNLTKMEDLPFPTISAVHGVCAAAGLELSLGCDLIWAGESAMFVQIEAMIGAATFLGGAQRLAERAGSARAKEIVFTADLYDAATFERWNIVNKVVPDAELWDQTLAFATRLAAGPTRAHAVTKRLIRSYLEDGILTADREILDVATRLFETEDMQGNVRTLLEHGAKGQRERAQFEGR